MKNEPGAAHTCHPGNQISNRCDNAPTAPQMEIRSYGCGLDFSISFSIIISASCERECNTHDGHFCKNEMSKLSPSICLRTQTFAARSVCDVYIYLETLIGHNFFLLLFLLMAACILFSDEQRRPLRETLRES